MWLQIFHVKHKTSRAHSPPVELQLQAFDGVLVGDHVSLLFDAAVKEPATQRKYWENINARLIYGSNGD